MDPAPLSDTSHRCRIDVTSAPAGADPDALIHRLAADQHGVVSRPQLLDAGVRSHVIDHRVRRGRLRPLHRGVYRVGPIRGRREPEMAALLACGPGAVLSHRSAARLWGLLREEPGDVPVEVSVHPGHPERGPSIRAYRSRVPEPDRAEQDGLSLTSAGRTILDLAASTDARGLERALARAGRLELLPPGALQDLLERYPRRRGTPLLRALLEARAEPAFVRSEAEELLLGLVRRAGIRPPEVNVVVRGWEVDFLWRRPGLVVEVDGFAFHRSASAFERDRTRDGILTAAGFRVMRVTWRQLHRRPEAVLVRLAKALEGARRERPS